MFPVSEYRTQKSPKPLVIATYLWIKMQQLITVSEKLLFQLRTKSFSSRVHVQIVQNLVKLLQFDWRTLFLDNIFVVGISWYKNWNFMQKMRFSILSRPSTIRTRKYEKCLASKILRLFKLFFGKKVISCVSIHEYVAFTSVFWWFWMRYSEPTKRSFQKILVVLNLPIQMQTL